ncbi:MAG: ATP-binding response regulator [Actinomycetota bacterium]
MTTPLILRGLAAYFADQHPDIQLSVVAPTVAEAIATWDSRTSVALLDIHLGDGSTPEGNVRALTQAGAEVLILTSEHRPTIVHRVLEAETAADVARRQEVRRVQGLLHDHVAAALRALSLPAVGDVEARTAAAEALAAWRSRPRVQITDGPRPLHSAIQDIAVPTGLSVTTHADDVGPLPADVVAAFERAAAECLRNVARHAGSPIVVVTLRRDGVRVTLAVEDAGRGIGEDRGFGLTRPVGEVMRAVGGEVEVGRGHDGGTRVLLAWSDAPTPVPPTRPHLVMRSCRSRSRRAACRTMPRGRSARSARYSRCSWCGDLRGSRSPRWWCSRW